MQQPEIRLISRPAGSLKALVFIDGYWSADNERHKLLSELSYLGWQNSVYHLWWDGSCLESCLMGLGIPH